MDDYTDHPMSSKSCPECNTSRSVITGTRNIGPETIKYSRCLDCGAVVDSQRMPRAIRRM